MTAENRIVVKLSDIVLVRFECRKCHAVFSWPPSKWERLPYTCQNCQEPWLIHGCSDEAFIQNLKEAIQRLAKLGTGLPFDLAFEFNRSDP